MHFVDKGYKPGITKVKSTVEVAIETEITDEQIKSSKLDLIELAKLKHVKTIMDEIHVQLTCDIAEYERSLVTPASHATSQTGPDDLAGGCNEGPVPPTSP